MLMAERRKLKEKVREQNRDRTGRSRPKQEAEVRARAEAHAALEFQRAQARSRLQQERQAREDAAAAAAAADRARFDAQCAERVRAQAERAEAVQRSKVFASWAQCARCAFVDHHREGCVPCRGGAVPTDGCACRAEAHAAADSAGLHCICSRCGELLGFCDCPPPEENPARARSWDHPAFRNADRALKNLLKALWYERIGGSARPSTTSTEPHLPITQIANERRRHAFERGLADWTPFDEWCPWHFEYARGPSGR